MHRALTGGVRPGIAGVMVAPRTKARIGQTLQHTRDDPRRPFAALRQSPDPFTTRPAAGTADVTSF